MTDIVERLRQVKSIFWGGASIPGGVNKAYPEMVEAADEIERLCQRVKELEGYEQECSNLEAELSDYQNCLAELAELRKAQGNPIAWAWKMNMSDVTTIKPDNCELINYVPLYTSAPSIPEGWQLVPVEPTPEMKRAPWQKPDENTELKLRTSLVYWQAMMAAAPKYGVDKQ